MLKQSRATHLGVKKQEPLSLKCGQTCSGGVTPQCYPASSWPNWAPGDQHQRSDLVKNYFTELKPILAKEGRLGSYGVLGAWNHP